MNALHHDPNCCVPPATLSGSVTFVSARIDVSCLSSRSDKCCNQAAISEDVWESQNTCGVPSKQPSPARPVLAMPSPVHFSRPRNKLLKRIPRASRGLATKSLTSVLNSVVDKNNHKSWSHLFFLLSVALGVCKEGKRLFLACVVTIKLGMKLLNLSQETILSPLLPLLLFQRRNVRLKLRKIP